MEGKETIEEGNKDAIKPKHSARRSTTTGRLGSVTSEINPIEVELTDSRRTGGSHDSRPPSPEHPGGTSTASSITPSVLPDNPQPFPPLDTPTKFLPLVSLGHQKRKIIGIGDQFASPGHENSEKIMEECTKAISKVMDFLVSPRKINKEASSFLVLAVREIECQMNLLVQENLKLRNKINVMSSDVELKKSQGVTKELIKEVVADALKQVTPIISPVNQRQPTFAEVIGRKEQQPPLSATVLVKPSEKAKQQFKSPGEIEREVKNKIKPKEQNLKILNIRTTHSGVVIRAHNQDVVKKIVEDGELAKVGLQLVELKKRNPRLIVYDVPSTMTAENFAEIFWEQNANNMNKDGEVFRPIFRTGRRDAQTVNWVVEVSPVLRKEVLNEGRIFLHWNSCRARDWTALTRCDKCQNFGHVKKHCESTYTYCGHCSERGHSILDCEKIQEPPKCINCSRSNKASNHAAMDKSCEAYNRALKRNINNTNYG